jgi:tau tubulin kinase
MLDAIEKLHDRGYIHRDIKPSNFVMGKGNSRTQVFMVDFGLAKLHLEPNGTFHCYHSNSVGKPIDQRPTADFRGTITYASLNAHNKIVEMWFMIKYRIYRGEMTYGAFILWCWIS